MSSSEEVVTSSEESSNDTSSERSGGTIHESDISESEEIVVVKRTKKKKPVKYFDSSEEDDNDSEEERAFSPITRLSITGVRPQDLPSDSSEIEYKKEGDKPKSSDSCNENESECDSKSSYVDESIEVKDEIQEDHTENVNTENNLPTKPEVNSPLRYSIQFRNAGKGIFSSTIYQKEEEGQCNISSNECDITSNECNATNPISGDSDLQIIDESVAKVEISSSEEDTAIVSLVKTELPPTFAKTSTNQTSIEKAVSKEYYDKELMKLKNLEFDLLNVKKLHAKISPSLPDGGYQLECRVKNLQVNVETQKKYISTLVIEDVTVIANTSISEKLQKFKEERKAVNAPTVPDWDELSEAVNQVKPIHTGRQGMQTFKNQKALTVDRLKDLHGSLETCPTEQVYAEDPKGLKVELMAHQKHALAWMNWREQQRPRGGILADDMGLGKTLTMISLVLACKNRSVEKHESDNDNGDSDNERNINKYHQGNTLVVCPASLLRQWEAETKSKVSRHKLTICVHHGCNRDSHPKHLRTYDIVVTTYNIVSREYKSRGAVFGIKWTRIILDEAHVVRNHKSQSSEAVCTLRGKYRWALTGTPIQNKEMDMYALLKFLRCSPFDDLSHWKKWIDKSAGGQQRLNTIMKSLMLRRTKHQLQEIGALQCLPEKSIKLIEVNLNKDEMNVYQKIMIYSRSLFAQFLYQRSQRGNDDNLGFAYKQTKNPNSEYYKVHEEFTKLYRGQKDIKSHEILVLLLRLRQICCHPGLIDAMLEDGDANNFDSESDSEKVQIDLLEQLNKLAITDDNTNKNRSKTNYSMPDNKDESTKISKASARVLHRSNPVFSLDRPSSKISKILFTLKESVLNTDDKAIVVSQWTSVLNILKTHLQQLGRIVLSLDGSIPVHKRQDIITEFNDPTSNKRILLLSLTAGGVGLNLIGANHLLLIDLHWNPQLEAQAQDRIYRVGQKKNVTIYKFMCKDTVEERIKKLQDHKLALANGVLTGARTSEGSKLTMDELKNLFGM